MRQYRQNDVPSMSCRNAIEGLVQTAPFHGEQYFYKNIDFAAAKFFQTDQHPLLDQGLQTAALCRYKRRYLWLFYL